MIILGIDPGTAITGYGVIEAQGNSYKVLEYGVIRSSNRQEMARRLDEIYQGSSRIIDLYTPDSMAIEELFFNKNVKTALSVGQARGVLILSAYQKGIPVYEYTPLQVKQAVVGYGRAEKQQVQFMVKALLNLQEIPYPDDAADALAIAICHSNFCFSGLGRRRESLD
ncbi:MAG: crossover junction endodeoxyribonuclease RuvC [Bacilli bacterium]|nr:crossover junction endodeoxyribonuclease RuvC [Clostridia bacterium]MDD4146162.1 crossover junction endodeoxyribonuclease RuvC [Clostridia bacterium]MDD4665597.1 crossover junction endodeoxyribonuclease RuvC [Clostridia bacterium]